MKIKVNIFSAVLALVFFLAVLSSFYFISSETNHSCSGEDCAICIQQNSCENSLRSMSPAFTVSALSVSPVKPSTIVLGIPDLLICHFSLVSLKVMLLN